MDFVLSKLLWLVLQPSNLLLLALLLMALLGWRRLLLATLGLILLATALPVGHWLGRPLEDRIPRPAAPPDDLAGIIVLGGAQDSHVAARRGVIATNDAAERLIEAAAIAIRQPEARLVFSGGSGRILRRGALERDVNERFVDLLQLDERRIVYEDNSRNTWENALFSKDLVDPQPNETWLLITSAAHMPRSLGIFRQLDWPVVPWPVDYRTTGNDFELQVGVGQRLDEIDNAMREWVGLAAYHLMGRTNTLFPGP